MVRNTSQYPVTKEEKLEALDWAIEKARQTDAIGGIKGHALTLVREEVAMQSSDFEVMPVGTISALRDTAALLRGHEQIFRREAQHIDWPQSTGKKRYELLMQKAEDYKNRANMLDTLARRS